MQGAEPPSGQRSLPDGSVREQIRGCLVAERLVWPLVIVKVKVVFQRRKQILAGGEVAGVDQLVLERPPQPFDENIASREFPTAGVKRRGCLAE